MIHVAALIIGCAKRVSDEVEVSYEGSDDSEFVERFEHAMVATGHRPNVVGANAANYPKRESFVTGELDFTSQGRSRVMLKNKGLMHIYADINTRRFVGGANGGTCVRALSALVGVGG